MFKTAGRVSSAKANTGLRQQVSCGSHVCRRASSQKMKHSGSSIGLPGDLHEDFQAGNLAVTLRTLSLESPRVG
jgi:hypothetical protein